MYGTARLTCVLMALVVMSLPGRALAGGNVMVDRFDGEPLAVEKAQTNPNDPWFRTFSLSVRNITQKPVYFAEFELELKDLNIDGKTIVMHLCYGEEEV